MASYEVELDLEDFGYITAVLRYENREATTEDMIRDIDCGNKLYMDVIAEIAGDDRIVTDHITDLAWSKLAGQVQQQINDMDEDWEYQRFKEMERDEAGL